LILEDNEYEGLILHRFKAGKEIDDVDDDDPNVMKISLDPSAEPDHQWVECFEKIFI
jgi:hypothetical protein